MSFLDEVREELQEERDDEQTNVHTVNIGISSHNHLVITQCVKALLDVKGCLQQIKFLILIDHLLGQPKGVQRLTS